MLPIYSRELAILLFVLAIAGLLWRYVADRRHIRKLQEDATRAFESLDIGSLEARFGLKGSIAVVERREETGGAGGLFASTGDLAVTIYAQNPHGERFLVKWSSTSMRAPFVKHLPIPDVSSTRSGASGNSPSAA